MDGVWCCVEIIAECKAHSLAVVANFCKANSHVQALILWLLSFG